MFGIYRVRNLEENFTISYFLLEGQSNSDSVKCYYHSSYYEASMNRPEILLFGGFSDVAYIETSFQLPVSFVKGMEG